MSGMISLMEIPQTLSIQYLYQYSGYPELNRSNGVYNACCPICKEGNSWGKKKRLFFIPKENYFYCHNCQSSWSAIDWIIEVSGKSYYDVLEEARDEGILNLDDFTNDNKIKKNESVLPFGSINLFDPQELSYYKKNKVIQDAINLISQRRLDTALNKVNLYISLKDFVYKNRICIPFKDINGRIIFYQCRSLYKKDEEEGRKYISKFNSDKSVFNIEKIDNELPYIFLFEGPIDSMFVRNGVGICGLSMTELQKSQMNRFFTHEKIWVLDNQRKDKSSMEKSLELVKNGEKVFVWPKKLQKYKDLNDLCCDLKKDQINPELFIKYSTDNEATFQTLLF